MLVVCICWLGDDCATEPTFCVVKFCEDMFWDMFCEDMGRWRP